MVKKRSCITTNLKRAKKRIVGDKRCLYFCTVSNWR